MKLNIKIMALCTLLTTCATTQSNDAIITFYIQKYPYVSKKIAQDMPKSQYDQTHTSKYSKKLRQPDYVYRTITKSNNLGYHEIPGVMCLYCGRAAVTTPMGQITFPRQQQTPNMYILVTKGIIPAYIIAPTTIHNWTLDTSQPAEMYYVQLKRDNATTLYYYETTKVDLPNDNNIPLNTIVFIADPQDMYIPLGATIVDYGSNIILPTMYIKRGFCFVYNSLYTLAIKQYFERLHPSLKQDGNTVAEIQQTF